MPVLIGILGLIVGTSILLIRARAAAEQEARRMAEKVRRAAGQFGLRIGQGTHPADAITRPDLAIAALGAAFLDLGRPTPAEQRHALSRALAAATGLSGRDSGRLLVLGLWICRRCDGPAGAVPHLARRLYHLAGADGFVPLMSVLRVAAESRKDGLTPGQIDALDTIRRAFHIT